MRWLVLLALWLAGPAAAAPTGLQAAVAPPGLEAAVEAALARYGGAGVAIAIVEDGRVTHAGGYGLARVAPAMPADAATLFPIGSNTKAMTAMLLAQQVEAGRLSWDDRVEDRLPGFRMADPWVSREVRVRDLMAHRTGMGSGQGDLLFWPETRLSGGEIVERIGWMTPTHGFRDRFQYSNVMVLVAGEVAAGVGGRPWAALLADGILGPLGLRQTLVSPEKGAPAGYRLASLYLPEGRGPGRPLRLVERPAHFPNAAATGGVWMSAADMGTWLCAVLASREAARPAGGCPAITSPGQLAEMWRAHTPMPLEPRGPRPADAARPRHLAYGLGWQLRDWRGEPMVMHSGTVIGGISLVALLPERGVGVAVMTNTHDRRLPRAIAWTLLDHYAGVGAVDWVGMLEGEAAGPGVRPVADAGVAPAGGPHRPLADYAGRYRDRWFGDLLVELRDGALFAHAPDAPRLSGPLRHVGAETFRAAWRANGTADAMLSFRLGPDGAVTGLDIAAAPGWDNDPYEGLDFRAVR